MKYSRLTFRSLGIPIATMLSRIRCGENARAGGKPLLRREACAPRAAGWANESSGSAGRWKILRAASIAREAQRERFEKVRAGDEGGFVEVEIVRLKRGAGADPQKEEEPGQMALIP